MTENENAIVFTVWWQWRFFQNIVQNSDTLTILTEISRITELKISNDAQRRKMRTIQTQRRTTISDTIRLASGSVEVKGRS